MKASILRKKILSLVVLFVCSLAMSAASPRNYLYDTKEENGKIVSKVIFLQEEGLLNKQARASATHRRRQVRNLLSSEKPEPGNNAFGISAGNEVSGSCEAVEYLFVYGKKSCREVCRKIERAFK